MITHALSRQNSLAPPLRPVVHTTRRGRDGPAVSRRFCCREMFRRRFMGGKRPDAAGCVEKLQFLCAARGVIVTAMPKASLAAIVKHCDQIAPHANQSAITTARRTVCRWKIPARSHASPPPWTPASPRSNSPSPPRRICSSSITDCSGRRRIRGRAKITNCSGCWWKTIWPFTVRTCRSTRIPSSATTRSFAPRWD